MPSDQCLVLKLSMRVRNGCSRNGASLKKGGSKLGSLGPLSGLSMDVAEETVCTSADWASGADDGVVPSLGDAGAA
jgi:hypothetical protein